MQEISPLQLGPFRLLEPIASGGMGVIWRGVHEGQGVSVAVKVMLGDELQSGAFRKAFRNEVWAMARLDHRGIVMVFDQGVISADLAAQSCGRLMAGAPYIVMDLVGNGQTLLDAPPRDWAELKGTLLLLLDALAHAHARGVIHRDLKPANILLDPHAAESGGLQLTDFGISHAVERALPAEQGAAPVMGTLHYMAPEQMDGRWRDFGPWTDLYSLGCIAWELACGRLPFDAEDPLDLMDLHLDEPPPLLDPVFDVPEGFAEWVYMLLEKEPFDRPSRASDVARELKGLGRNDDTDPTRDLGLTMADGIPAVQPQHIEEFLTRSLRSSHPAKLSPAVATLENELGLETLTNVAPVRVDVSVPRDDDEIDEIDEADVSAIRAGRRLNLTWRRHRRPRKWKRLAGVGLGLWGLRQTPLVGRDQELDRIWTELRSAHRDHAARAVIVDGPLGVGSSRVALWMCERAHELGVADILWATHAPQKTPANGLGRMLAREFRCVGLSSPMQHERVEELLLRRDLANPDKAEEFAKDLTRWMALHRASPVPSVSTLSAVEGERPRFKSLYRFLRRMARRRPVVLWIDDAQWGLEALAFAWYVLRAQESKPANILILLSMQRAGLEDDEEVTQILRQVDRHPSTMRIPIPALGEHDLEYLLSDLLGLEQQLAAKVASSSGGNPLFATQLMGEWVRRGVLEPGPWGFRLGAGEEASIPQDLPALWEHRIENALEGMGPEGFHCLVVAAAMGGRVHHDVFRSGCDTLGFTPPRGFLDRLYSEQLAVPSKSGWSFVHDGLRVAVQRRAHAAGMWRAARHAARELRRGPPVARTTVKTAVVG
ncbi:MAG: protein kinase [Deltaproteobacteria bacterium]|nr:protein kinase [Deltaproteobacteria bacterium]